MKDEAEPVTPDEFVFRRILNRPGYYDPGLPRPVVFAAMRHTDKDVDGISVYREACGATAEGVAASGKNPSGYCVARIRVQDILLVGQEVSFGLLHIEPSPRPAEVPGHATIRELSTAARDHPQVKTKTKELIGKLAELAGQSIVFAPPPPEV